MIAPENTADFINDYFTNIGPNLATKKTLKKSRGVLWVKNLMKFWMSCQPMK